MADIALRRTWAPVYTGSQWVTVLGGMRAMLQARGSVNAMTNAEAVAFIREWRDVSASGSRLWSQFAAVAYGWDPKTDRLNRSTAQAARLYAMTPEVFAWANGIARELDERADVPPRIAVNKDTFRDPAFFGSVRSELQQDGARASFKIPLPVCKDKKTGKTRFPRPGEKPGDCDVVIVDDPVTHLENQLTMLLLVVGAVWLLTQGDSRTAAHR